MTAAAVLHAGAVTHNPWLCVAIFAALVAGIALQGFLICRGNPID